MTGHILPDTNSTYDIGSAEYKIRDLYLSNNSLWIGDEYKTTINPNTNQLEFKRRNVNIIPQSFISQGIDDPTLILSAVGVASLNNMTLGKWKQAARLLNVPINGIVGENIDANYIFDVTEPSDWESSIDINTLSQQVETLENKVGQSVGPTDNVQFNSITVNGTLNSDHITGVNITVSNDLIVTGNLTVNGTRTIINTTTLDVDDNIIVVNSSGAISDAGIIANVNGVNYDFIYSANNNGWGTSGNLIIGSNISAGGSLSIDSINEKTSNNGVVIEGVTIKDGNLQSGSNGTIAASNFNVGDKNVISASRQGTFTDLELKNNYGTKLLIDGDSGDITSHGNLSIDSINEKTSNNGVVIEGVTIKDGNLQSGSNGTIAASNFNVGDKNVISASRQGTFTDLELKNNYGTKLLIDGDSGDITSHGNLSIDSINEKTSNNGVVIEGVIVKGNTVRATSFIGDGSQLTNIPNANIIGGTGVTYSNSTISIGQSVNTSDNVAFNDISVNDIITNSLSVSGAVTITGNINVAGASKLNIDNISSEDGYKTLLYNSITKEVGWTSGSLSSTSETLTIETNIPTLTNTNTGKYYLKTVGTTQQLRLRIKSGIASYQDLLIGTYDTVDPTIELIGGSLVIISIGDIYNDNIIVNDAGISETITFGGQSYPYNTDISTTFGSIRANLALSDNPTNYQSSIDIYNANTYTINYIATDNAGNTKEVVRTLYISVNVNFYHYYYKENSNINLSYNTIDENYLDNYLGYAVSINSAANLLAYAQNNGANKIIIQAKTNNIWSQYGNQISTINNRIANIMFDNGGNTLIFNDMPSSGNLKVYIYTNNGSDFTNLQTIYTSRIHLPTINNHNSLSISGNGSIILVWYSTDNTKIYKLDTTKTVDPYNDEKTINFNAFSSSINNDGSKIILGDSSYDNNNGIVRLYNFPDANYDAEPTITEFTSSTLGLTNTGHNYLGYDVSISDTGRFAFSALHTDNSNNIEWAGSVFIYEGDSSLLTTIHGYNHVMGFGTKVELSKNGKVIAITAKDSYYNGGSLPDAGTSTGFIKMYYEYQERTATAHSVWLEIDHKNLYSDTSDQSIKFGFSSALDYSGTKLLIGSPNYDVNNVTSVGNISLYEYSETDAKIYNSWDLYLADKTTAESGLNINDLTNIEVYFAPNKYNPHIATTDNKKFTDITDSTLDDIHPIVNIFGSFSNGIGIFGKYDNLKANSRPVEKYIIYSPNYKEYLSGSVNGDIFFHPPQNSAGANVIKIPIKENGDYVIYNSFIWPFWYGMNYALPVGISIYTGNDTSSTNIIELTFNKISSGDTNNSYKNFLKYYSGDNGSGTNYDTINGLELGTLTTENSDNIYICCNNAGNWEDENSVLRFQIAKRATIPTDYKHIVTINKNQPVCNPWNGTAIDELAPTVYNPLVTYSKYKGRDLEIKLEVNLEDNTTETFKFAGWRLDEVFNFYLKNGANTQVKVFAKSSLSNDTWFTADNISSYKLNDSHWQWSFTDEDHNSATPDTGFGHRNDTGINNVGVMIGSDGAGENIQKLWTRNHAGNNIKNINVSMKEAGVMAVPNEEFETTITTNSTYSDKYAKLYEWDITAEEYVERTPSSPITSSFSPISDPNTSSSTLDTSTAGTYIQTYYIPYDGETYTTTRTIIINHGVFSIISDTTRHYNPVVLKDGVSIFTFVDSDWTTGIVKRGLAFVIIDITTLQIIEKFTFDTYNDTNGGIESTYLISWLNNLSTYNNPNHVIFGAVVEVFHRSYVNPDNAFSAIRNSLGGTISSSNTNHDDSYAIISRFNSTGTATLLDEKFGGQSTQVTASATI